MSTIAKVRQEIPDLKMEVIDLADRTDLAVKYRVMATPAIAINGVLAFSSVPKEADLRRRLLEVAREEVCVALEKGRRVEGKGGQLFNLGIVGTILACVVCFTPAAVALLGLLGLAGWAGNLDYALFPLLGLFLFLLGYSYWPRRQTGGERKPCKHTTGLQD